MFEVWGDYACFRRFYTTRSPLSYPFPPRPTLAGLVGAIAGIPKGEVSRSLSAGRARLAVALTAPVKTLRLGINWVETKDPAIFSIGAVGDRTQINAEFLKDPRFRVYVQVRDDTLQTQLSALLREHRSVFTPCLGISELLADFAWVGELPASPAEPGLRDIISVLPLSKVRWPEAGQGIEFEVGKSYNRQRVPRLQDEERAVTEWQDVVVESSGQTIRAETDDCWRVGDDYVVWL